MDRGSAVAAHGHGEPCAVRSSHGRAEGQCCDPRAAHCGRLLDNPPLNDRAAVLTADLVADFITGLGSEAKIAGGDLA